MKKNLLLILVSMLVIVPSLFAQNKNTKTHDNTVVLYVTRHGKTILNTMDRVQGWADTPLTSAGIEVAEYLGKGLQLEGVEFKAAYSSDLGRARQTARIVLDTKGQNNLTVTELPQVRETNFGSYEGDYNLRMWTDAAFYLHYKSREELFDAFSKNPNMMNEIVDSFKALETLGIGESYDEVKARGQQAIREIVEKEAKNGGGNILLVGHGMSIGIFLSDIDSSGKKAKGGHIGNASVSKLVYKDGIFSLESFGDMSYVEKGKSALIK